MRSLVLLLSLIAFVHSVALPQTHTVHERRDSHPRQWIKRSRISSKALLPMRIGLTQSNLEKGHDILMDLSYPGSSSYARHWTSTEVIDMFAPTEEAVETLRTWLVDSGITNERITHSDNRQWLAFYATTEEAESLLHTEYHEYEHSESGHIAPSCDIYHVPKHIQKHVDYITPGINLVAHKKRTVNLQSSAASMQKRQSNASNPFAYFDKECSNDVSTCDKCVTPLCIAALYNIPAGTKADPGNAMGIFETTTSYNQKDLDAFFARFTPGIPQGTHPLLQSIDGGEAPTTNITLANNEAELDFDIAYPILWPQQTILYQAGDLPESVLVGAVSFNNFLDALDGSYCTFSAYGETGDDPNIDGIYPDPLTGGYKGPLQCGVYTPTNVISISYGDAEANYPPSYQKRQCLEFMKLGMQGVSVIISSGDNGVAGSSKLNDTTCLGANDTIFSPQTPANCPYVTSVGATQVNPCSSVNEPESVANNATGHGYNFSSGGGFSNIYPIPAYQRSALATYFANHTPPYESYAYLPTLQPGNASFGANGGRYNRIGRGYPDVSANGVNIASISNGILSPTEGTSAAAPIFASVLNRINEERIAVGKQPVGFVNPVLYANPEVLNDITSGHNIGCGSNGFGAVKGWDPVSGLGTPNYPKMLKLFMDLP